MGAHARRHRVVGGAHAGQSGEARLDALGVVGAGKPGEAETESEARAIGRGEPGLGANRVDRARAVAIAPSKST